MPSAERAHYLHHNNDVDDPRYQKFVEPVLAAILKRLPHNTPVSGLDFGAGTGSVLAHQLKQQAPECVIEMYDPYFHNHPELLSRTYDFIFACEVVEHFYDPAAEFQRLSRMLKPGGFLAIMTDLFHAKTTDFERWYYRLDPTHTVFYSRRTIEWIATGSSLQLFSGVVFEGPRVAVFSHSNAANSSTVAH